MLPWGETHSRVAVQRAEDEEQLQNLEGQKGGYPREEEEVNSVILCNFQKMRTLHLILYSKLTTWNLEYDSIKKKKKKCEIDIYRTHHIFFSSSYAVILCIYL